ncbi:hypothetical protein CKO18_02305 [Rhodoferax fermentans]|uniref:Uncharacterized protein n=1 Tax=Rhodoferax fermentans TaxID=28066 RepID=A0A1T1AU76_RHOFE|nr:hypothetical protein [Rhodoferax fermentans]OOV07650.1 hypothetical protein RF819_13775 [Rhodoferax fermentans]
MGPGPIRRYEDAACKLNENGSRLELKQQPFFQPSAVIWRNAWATTATGCQKKGAKSNKLAAQTAQVNGI